MTELNVKLLSYTKDPEKIITAAAKLCYSNAEIDDLMNNLTEEKINNFVSIFEGLGHESPFEHASFSFGIEGVSRITEIQLVRHRLASYSIQSGRYVNRRKTSFIIPPNIKNSSTALARYNIIANESMSAYNDLFIILMLVQMGYSDERIEKISVDKRIDIVGEFFTKDKKAYKKYEKVAIEDARYAHLQSLSTKIIVTMNIRELWNFFKHRCCNRAQWEIRAMAKEMLKLCKETSPLLFKNSGPSCITGLGCPENNMQCNQYKGLIPTQNEVKDIIKEHYNK